MRQLSLPLSTLRPLCTPVCFRIGGIQRFVKVSRSNPLPPQVVPAVGDFPLSLSQIPVGPKILRGNVLLSWRRPILFCRLFSFPLKKCRESLQTELDIAKGTAHLMSTHRHLNQHIYQTVCQKKLVFILYETSFFS